MFFTCPLWSFQYGLVLLAIYISPLWGYFRTTKLLPIKMFRLLHIFLICFCCFLSFVSGYAESVVKNHVHEIINSSTITRVQKPLIVRSDRKTLEYFIELVEEIVNQGRDFQKGELLLEPKGNGRYGIQIPSKNITGEFELMEQTSDKATYVGQGNARSFLSFSGAIVLQVNYTTQHDENGNYEDVRTAVHLKFDNAFFAMLTKAVSPILIPKLDRLIAQFSNKTKNVIESAYTNKEGTQR